MYCHIGVRTFCVKPLAGSRMSRAVTHEVRFAFLTARQVV